MTTILATSTGIADVFSLQFLIFLALAFSSLLLLGFSAIFGGHHDAEMGHDVAAESDHGHDHEFMHGDDVDPAPSFLSPRAFFAFLLGFSTTGAIATCYGAGSLLACGIGLIPGLLMAVLAWWVAVLFYNQQANSSLRPGQVVGALGTVVTHIKESGLGEVNVSVGGQIVGYSAMAENGTAIKSGTPITVTKDLGDRIVVKPTNKAA